MAGNHTRSHAIPPPCCLSEQVARSKILGPLRLIPTMLGPVHEMLQASLKASLCRQQRQGMKHMGQHFLSAPQLGHPHPLAVLSCSMLFPESSQEMLDSLAWPCGWPVFLDHLVKSWEPICMHLPHIHLGQLASSQFRLLSAKQAVIHTVVLSGISADDKWPAALPPHGIWVQASVDSSVKHSICHVRIIGLCSTSAID